MFCSSFFVCFLCFSLKGFFEHVKVRKQQSGFTAFGPNCNVEAVDLVMVLVRQSDISSRCGSKFEYAADACCEHAGCNTQVQHVI